MIRWDCWSYRVERHLNFITFVYVVNVCGDTFQDTFVKIRGHVMGVGSLTSTHTGSGVQSNSGGQVWWQVP